MMTLKEIKSLKRFFADINDVFGTNIIGYEMTSDDSIYVTFPREEEWDIEYEFEEIAKYLEEIKSIAFDKKFEKVTTNHITQRVIEVSSNTTFYALLSLGLLRKVSNNIQIQLIHNPILIGIGATYFEQYNSYHPPCSRYIAVEIVYPDINSRLSEEEEEKLIKIFMFELAHNHKLSFEFSSYNIQDDFEKESLEVELRQSLDFLYNIPAEDYNFGMDLYIQANQNLSNDLKYLSYYKIFEYFAPVKAKMEAYTSMSIKLTSSNVTKPDANFISSIFDLAKNYDKTSRDNELVKSLIDTTFDLVDLYSYLPQSLIKNFKIEKLTYGSKKETKDRVINDLGNILYQTRNSIVHAKSNFDSKGLECSKEDLEQLNIFMHKACYSVIRWYSSLPLHLKIKI